MFKDVYIIPDELKVFLSVVFYSEPNKIVWDGSFLYIIYLLSLVMHLFIYRYFEDSYWL